METKSQHHLILGVADNTIAGCKVSEWVTLSQQQALDAIREYVFHGASDVIDALDATFMYIAALQTMPALKVQLLQHYAYFKIIEFKRFGVFRGFPPFPVP